MALRALTGAGLAGVYPVGMKVLVGWGTRDRGTLVGLFVGAITVGNALPHLFAFLGGADWRATVVATSALAVLGGVCGARRRARSLPRPRRRASIPARCGSPGATGASGSPMLGYLGHMWELYAFWAWIGAAAGGVLRRPARRGGDAGPPGS